MIEYADLQRANEAIQTTTIEKENKKTGKVTKKEYAEVHQRIKAFRMVFPDGFITTDILSNENGVVVIKALCGYYSDDVPLVLGTGTAYEKEGSSFINQSSYIENCETSAVGRALGMAGFGIDTSIASAEEVQNAMLNQSDKPDATTILALRKRLEKYDFNIEGICEMYGVGSLVELDYPAISKLNEQINNALKKRGIKE